MNYEKTLSDSEVEQKINDILTLARTKDWQTAESILQLLKRGDRLIPLTAAQV